MALLMLSLPLSAATATWNGGGADDNWSTTANWVLGVAPAAGDDLVFGGSRRPTPNNNLTADISFNSITFNSGAGAFVIGGNSITLAGDVTNNDNSVQTINLAMIMAVTRIANAASANLAFGGILSGAGGLTKSGANMLTLTGTNTYTGVTTISAGTLSIGNGTTDGSIATSAGITNNAALIYNLVGARTYGNVISGTGTLTKSGAGALTLSGANTFSGGLTLSAGTLNVNSTTALGAAGGTFTVTGGTIDNTSGGALTLANNNPQAWNGNFTFTGSNALNLGTGAVAMNANRQVTVSASTLTVGGVIGGGALTLTKLGTGTLELNGISTYSGQTTVSAGTLRGTGTLAGPLSVAGGTVAGGSSGANGTFNGGTTGNLSSAGTLRTRIAGYAAGSTFDRLALSGALTLGGTSALALDLTGLNATGTATGIITCTGTPVAFSSVTISNNPNNYIVTLQYAAGSVNVVVSRRRMGGVGVGSPPVY